MVYTLHVSCGLFLVFPSTVPQLLLQLAIVSYTKTCHDATTYLQTENRAIEIALSLRIQKHARTRGVITCNTLWSEFDFTELAFRSVFRWVKKIITTVFVFYMGNNKTSAESFRTVSRGPLLRTCLDTRVGRCNINNDK